MHNRLRVAEHLTALAQQFNHASLRAEHGLARQLGVAVEGRAGDDGWGFGDEATIRPNDRAVGQVELAPPDDVGHVAEGADHGDARSLVFLCEVVCEHRHLNAEQRSGHGGAEILLVALVVGMSNESHARRQQFGPSRLNLDGAAVGLVERHPVVRGRLLLVFELGLRDGGAEGHVPEGRGLGLVRLAARQVVEEHLLGDALRLVADGAVGERPVNREAEVAPQRLELLLVFDREALAQLDEVAAAHRKLVGGFA